MTKNKDLALDFAIGMVLPVGELLAQHSFTPEEVAYGGRLYAANCTGCRGTKGDGVSSAELMTGKFRRATSDDDVVKLVRNGIPHVDCRASRT